MILFRRLATEGKLFTEANINGLLTQTEIQNVLAYTAPQNGRLVAVADVRRDSLIS